MAGRRIKTDYQAIIAANPENYVVRWCETDMFRWSVWLKGPDGTPYEGGTFRADLTFPFDFPLKPVEVVLKTPIYHPNFGPKGQVCLELIKGKWSPVIKTIQVLEELYSRLVAPEADGGLQAEIAAQLRDNRPLFEQTAKEWTQKFAAEGVPDE
jgi:ubiquitin-conjugating enzyme E2 D/E